ncbi:MAG TPA: YdeI/OmpD-associated family protein [Planctomycetota bacterium]|nr:YdeI/OmpD-associated family protein [Planctomycetota bacterium]
MPKKDARIDAYIAKSADFAQPILTHIRKLIHEECPDVEETLKWSMPSFMYRGILCNMASFKQHCAFGFWKHKLVVGGERVGMGFGKMTSLADLPSDATMRAYIRKAMKLNEDGVKTSPAKKAKKATLLAAPPYFLNALKKNKKALATYDAFAPSKKNEYIEWVTEAKAEETRARRLAQAVEWMAEGKARNWKYEKC